MWMAAIWFRSQVEAAGSTKTRQLTCMGASHAQPREVSFMHGASVTLLLARRALPGRVVRRTVPEIIQDVRTMRAALAIGLIITSLPAHGAQYIYTSLDTAGQTSGVANAVNDAGQVVGTYNDSAGQHAYVWQAGQFATIIVPGASIVPTAINRKGEVVGNYVDGKSGGAAFTYDSHTHKGHRIWIATGLTVAATSINSSGFKTIGEFNGQAPILGLFHSHHVAVPMLPSGQQFSLATALNDSDVVGGDVIDESLTENGFYYKDGIFTIIALGSDYCSVTAVSQSGAIGGTYGDGGDVGYSLENGNYTLLRYPGAFDTEVVAYGQPGQIVGNYDAAPPYGGFNWVNGTYYQIDPFSAPTVRITGASPNGSITGSYTDNSNVTHGFVGICPTGQGTCTQ
jgi:probable HAF family extracellular repeat protein